MSVIVDAEFTQLVATTVGFIRATCRRNERLVAQGRAITCPVCLATSHNVNDVREGFCGWCHAFTSRPADWRTRPRHNAHHCPVCTAGRWRDLDGAGTRFSTVHHGGWTLADAPLSVDDPEAGWYLYGPEITALFLDTDVERALHMATQSIRLAARHLAVLRGELPEGERSGSEIR